MWSDNESSRDLLGYHHLVAAIRSVLEDDSLLPATLGVFGDWGSGKSTLIRMARAELEKDKETLVLSFNGWLFEGYEDAKLALMGTIVDELADHKRLTVKGKELVLGLVRRINGWRLAGAGARVLAGYAMGGWAGVAVGTSHDVATLAKDLLEKAKDVKPEELGKFLRENNPGQQLRRGVREFRDDFTQLLEETKLKRLVVIVDDLDRCAPDTVIETLEAIKLFLFVPKTAFIIGADERLIRYAVRKRFPELPGERAEVGRDYLEKLIQFPVFIPPMGRGETETYIKLLLAQRCILEDAAYERLRACGVVADASLDAGLGRASIEKALGTKPEKDLDEALALAERISPVLAAGLFGNPRQCKRFLNTLIMRLAMARSRGAELKQRILAKLMLLEYLKPESFKELARLQAAQAGRPVELALLERPAAKDKIGSAEPIEKPVSSTAKPAPAKGSAARPTTITDRETKAEATAGTLASWPSDAWLSEWLGSEPVLRTEDLRPYFYVAREKLDSLSGLALRMSPEAQNTLTKLLGPTAAERTLVVSRASQHSSADAAAIFEALARRTREAETLSATDSSPLLHMFEWIDARPELFAEFMTFLKSLPETAVPFAITPRVVGLASTAERKPQVAQLLIQWKGGGNGQLRKTAATALEQLNK